MSRLTDAVDIVDSFLRRLGRSYLPVIVIALVVGALLAPVVIESTASGPSEVAVVPIAGTIDGPNEQRISAQLTRAQEDPDIEAVVLLVSSGGGSAVSSEELYLQVSRTAEEMPVVASVDAGALSGAYYAVAPSDAIYAKPASSVGSVGVIAPLPQDVDPNDQLATTGPDKASPDDRRAFLYRIEEIKNAFVNSVYEHRGDRLELERDELSEAGTYVGTEAVRLGLVDRVGGREQAIARAAQEAGLEEYAITTLRGEGTVRFVAQSNYVASTAPDKELVSPSYLTGGDTAATRAGTYLAVPPSYAAPETGPLLRAGNRTEVIAGE